MCGTSLLYFTSSLYCTCTTRIGDEQEIFSLQWWFDYYLLTIVIVTVSTHMCKLRHCF
jgi:hypothetical protein